MKETVWPTNITDTNLSPSEKLTTKILQCQLRVNMAFCGLNKTLPLRGAIGSKWRTRRRFISRLHTPTKLSRDAQSRVNSSQNRWTTCVGYSKPHWCQKPKHLCLTQSSGPRELFPHLIGASQAESSKPTINPSSNNSVAAGRAREAETWASGCSTINRWRTP